MQKGRKACSYLDWCLTSSSRDGFCQSHIQVLGNTFMGLLLHHFYLNNCTTETSFHDRVNQFLDFLWELQSLLYAKNDVLIRGLIEKWRTQFWPLHKTTPQVNIQGFRFLKALDKQWEKSPSVSWPLSNCEDCSGQREKCSWSIHSSYFFVSLHGKVGPDFDKYWWPIFIWAQLLSLHFYIIIFISVCIFLGLGWYFNGNTVTVAEIVILYFFPTIRIKDFGKLTIVKG